MNTIRQSISIIRDLLAEWPERELCAPPREVIARLEEMLPPDDYWGEDESWPVSDWAFAAANGETRLGYWEWVKEVRSLYEEDTEKKYEEDES